MIGEYILSKLFWPKEYLIIATDREPDDLLTLSLASLLRDRFSETLVGACFKNTAVKTALLKKDVKALGWENVRVCQGTGGSADSYGKVPAMSSALSFQNEGKDVLDDNRLTELKAQSPSSLEFQKSMIDMLERAEDGTVTIQVIAQATDVANVFKERSDLKCKVKEIFLVGGYAIDPDTKTARSTFNTDCDPEAMNDLLNSGLPITYFSTHVITSIQGGSFSNLNAEKVMNTIKEFTEKFIFFKHFDIGRRYWNEHVKSTLSARPDVQAKIEKNPEQMTFADVFSILAIADPSFIRKKILVQIAIDARNRGENPCGMSVVKDARSSVSLVTEVDADSIPDRVYEGLQKLEGMNVLERIQF